jgi:hypothetical protein
MAIIVFQAPVITPNIFQALADGDNLLFQPFLNPIFHNVSRWELSTSGVFF